MNENLFSNLVHGEKLVFFGLVELQSLVETFDLLNGVESCPLVLHELIVQHGQDPFDPLQVSSAEDEDLSLFTSDFPENMKIGLKPANVSY